MENTAQSLEYQTRFVIVKEEYDKLEGILSVVPRKQIKEQNEEQTKKRGLHILLIDVSASMYSIKGNLIEVLESYLNSLEENDKVAIILFGTNAYLVNRYAEILTIYHRHLYEENIGNFKNIGSVNFESEEFSKILEKLMGSGNYFLTPTEAKNIIELIDPLGSATAGGMALYLGAGYGGSITKVKEKGKKYVKLEGLGNIDYIKLIMITDGETNSGPNNKEFYEVIAEMIKKAGVPLIAQMIWFASSYYEKINLKESSKKQQLNSENLNPPVKQDVLSLDDEYDDELEEVRITRGGPVLDMTKFMKEIQGYKKLNQKTEYPSASKYLRWVSPIFNGGIWVVNPWKKGELEKIIEGIQKIPVEPWSKTVKVKIDEEEKTIEIKDQIGMYQTRISLERVPKEIIMDEEKLEKIEAFRVYWKEQGTNLGFAI